MGNKDEAAAGVRPSLPEPWCAPDCPRQQTHMWKDCNCGGAGREFTWLRARRDEDQE